MQLATDIKPSLDENILKNSSLTTGCTFHIYMPPDAYFKKKSQWNGKSIKMSLFQDKVLEIILGLKNVFLDLRC